MRICTLKLLSIFCVLLHFSWGDARAQLLIKSSEKIGTLKSFIYTDIVQTKFSFQEDYYSDTLRSYLVFRRTGQISNAHFLLKGTDISYSYEGGKLVTLNFKDSTYNVQKEIVLSQDTRTLAYWAVKMRKLSVRARKDDRQDTIINGVSFANVRVVESDTTVNKEHFYNISNYIIDKSTKLPIKIISRFRGAGDDGTVFSLIEIHNYSNFLFNQKTGLSPVVIPSYFKLPVSQQPIAFLANGVFAPPLEVFDLAGSKLNLNKLKGKMVLVNFSLIGCPHCVGAAQMLNRLNEKYMRKDLVILNIYPIDSPEAIAKFDQKEDVRTSSFTSTRLVRKLYPFDGYPSFYLIDKQGKIAQSYTGFYKELENQIVEKIDSSL